MDNYGIHIAYPNDLIGYMWWLKERIRLLLINGKKEEILFLLDREINELSKRIEDDL